LMVAAGSAASAGLVGADAAIACAGRPGGAPGGPLLAGVSLVRGGDTGGATDWMGGGCVPPADGFGGEFEAASASFREGAPWATDADPDRAAGLALDDCGRGGGECSPWELRAGADVTAASLPSFGTVADSVRIDDSCAISVFVPPGPRSAPSRRSCSTVSPGRTMTARDLGEHDRTFVPSGIPTPDGPPHTLFSTSIVAKGR
jgi:hypothetical protein